MKTLIYSTVCSLVLFTVAASFAQSDSVLEKMAKLTDEDTFAVLYVDVAAIQPAESLKFHRTWIERTAKNIGLDFPELVKLLLPPELQKVDLDTQWNALLTTTELGKTTLVYGLGVRDVFVVLSCKAFPNPVFVAVVKNEKLQVDIISQLVSQQTPHCLIRETDDFLLLSLQAAPWSSSHLNRGSADNPPVFGPTNPIPRPDLIAAHQEVKEFPIRLMGAVPLYVKKILRTLPPELPLSFLPKNLDVAAIITAGKYKGVGIDPLRGRIYTVAVMESPETAKMVKRELGAVFSSCADALLQYVKTLSEQQATSPGSLDTMEETLATMYPELLNKENLTVLQNAILPEPIGDRFIVDWKLAEISEKVPTSSALLAKLAVIQTEEFRETARRQQCLNHFKQLVLAMHNHHDTNICFPPAFTTNAEGKPLHSWRVALLPYLGQVELYKKIRLEEPWDSEYNSQFHNKMPNIFRCPSCTAGDPNRDTIYCMVVGKDTFGTTDQKGIHFSKIMDGTSNTIMFVERQTPVCWMKPEDISQEDAMKGLFKTPLGLGSPHPHRVLCGFCDGSARTIPSDISAEKLKAALTKAGGEIGSW